MGHSITAGFSSESRIELKFLMKKSGGENANKVPLGRKCDREIANSVFNYHITLFNWSKHKDEIMLRRLEGFSFPGECHVTAEKPIMVHAEENSVMICLKVKPSDDFKKMTNDLQETIGHSVSEHLYITLAVSQNHSEMHKLYKKLKEENIFPLELTVDHLELYKIWQPVELVREYK